MRRSYRKSFSSPTWKAESGSITLPLLILSVLLTSGALSSLGYAMIWKSKVALQLRLDECVENTSLELERIQNQIESSNLRMRIERAAAIAAAIPSAGVSLKSVKPILIAEQAFQEFLRMKWRTRQLTWVTRQGCSGKRDRFLPLPNLKWWRPPDDPVGARPLEWEGEKKTGLSIRLWRSNRFSQSRVGFGGKDGNGNRWQANWTSLY